MKCSIKVKVLIAILIEGFENEDLRYIFRRNIQQLMKNPASCSFFGKFQDCHGTEHSEAKCMETASTGDYEVGSDLLVRLGILKHQIPANFFSNDNFTAEKIRKIYAAFDSFESKENIKKAEAFFNGNFTLKFLCSHVCKTKNIDTSESPLSIRKYVEKCHYM